MGKRCRSSVVRASLIGFTGVAALAAPGRPASAQTLNANQQLARDIYKELIEINTTTDADPGGTTQAAEAMAKRLRSAGFPEADVQVLSAGPRDGNLVARLRGSGASGRKPILLLRDLIVALTSDEEGGEHNGVEWLLANKRELVDAAYALNEGGGGFLKKGKPFVHNVQAPRRCTTTSRSRCATRAVTARAL